MIKEIYCCEMCGKTADSERQLRKENWIEIVGNIVHCVKVYLNKPRVHKTGVASSYMLSVGYEDRDYHFCSTGCLVKALEGKESI